MINDLINTMTVKAIIVKKHTSQMILNYNGQEYLATTKSKKSDFVVGDEVVAEIAANKQARILKLINRKTLVLRSDHSRSKLIASNVSQVFIVISSQPYCNRVFLDACIIFCEYQHIIPVIVFNKADLPDYEHLYHIIYSLYSQNLNYEIITITALLDIDPLINKIINNSTLLIGQSGVGKSTITSKLLNYEIKSGLLSNKGKGCHTTSSTTLYYLNNNSSIIDSPGLDNFGIKQIDKHDLGKCFIEFRPFISMCKFRNCLHINEPGCIIMEQLQSGNIDIMRYRSYLSFIRQI
jgi:ribosome biogenesis GTPase